MATKWGVLSAGKICHDFVTATRSLPQGDHEFVAVAARSLESASEFAARHNIPKSYGSYDELAKDTNVEVVYIGTITSQHFSACKLMLEHKKHVLMEKPLTLNLKQTKTLIQMAQENSCFLMEAVWSRFLPSYRHLMNLIKDKAVGDIVHVHSNFGKPLTRVERLMKRSMGGGTLLDLGIYALNAVSVAYKGDKPQKIAAVGHLNDDGVDIAVTASLQYEGNRTASITTSALGHLPCDLVITGTEGDIHIPKPMWCPTVVVVGDKRYEFPLPETIMPCNFLNSSGLRYEAMEVRDCLKKGLLESPIMPLRDSELLAEIMDEIHQQIGVVYNDD